MKLKLSRLSSLLVALQNLDGLAKDKELTPFVFTSRVTWNKTKNLGIVERELEEIEKTRRSRVAQASGSKSKPVPIEKTAEFSVEWSEYLDTEQDIAGLLTFTPEDLNIFDKKDNPDGNKIPSTVLNALSPLIVFPEPKP